LRYLKRTLQIIEFCAEIVESFLSPIYNGTVWTEASMNPLFEVIQQIRKTVFEHISKHQEEQGSIFDEPRVVWICGQTQYSVFDISNYGNIVIIIIMIIITMIAIMMIIIIIIIIIRGFKRHT